MKTPALILFVLGVSFLIAGGITATVDAYVRSRTITCTGTIASPDGLSFQVAEDPMTQQTNPDITGYLMILSSIGFFSAGFVINRKKN